MRRKLRVGILFGGRSAEHEISLQSARNIVESIDKKKYELVLIGIDKDGRWYLTDTAQLLFSSGAQLPSVQTMGGAKKRVGLIPGKNTGELLRVSQSRAGRALDAIFPVLHGPFGEDGTVQGLLKLANVPFIGAGVLGSALGMDKDVMKRLLRDAGIPTAKFLVFRRPQIVDMRFADIVREIGLPFFIKPANLGSSVGISKVKNRNQFRRAVRDAFQYDSKVLLEEHIQGREIECSVLGNDHPIASLPGEILPRHEFYSYEAKYLDEKGAVLKIPAKLPPQLIREIQELSIRAFQVLCCEGMARVDFFLRDDREVLVNEINTIPGFTKISMYPKLWEASGLSYSQLIDRLVELALERFQRDARLKTSL
ncbi:MAG: D-alanine--D-alanine ligase [Deltaproteobacteria bacterium]|nr:D-alanine--D-alanine ligase [Deltaproteobacteria bacterium]